MSFTGTITGGLIDPGGPDYGKLAGKNEKRRKQIIDLGLQQVNAVFGGGSAPFYTAANTGTNKFDPHDSYYKLTAAHGFSPYWSPGEGPNAKTTPSQFGQIADVSNAAMSFGATVPSVLAGFGLGKLLGHTESPTDIARKSFNRGQLLNAPEYKTFEGFQDPFFEKRAQDYVNYALPQEAQQYRQNRLAMLYGLNNRGLQSSSVATQAKSGLERTAGEAKQTIADTALQQANQLRQDVENARQQSIQQLYQTADPGQATAGAIASAAGFQRPSTFAPIANMFGNLAQQYMTNQLLNSYRQPYGVPQGQNYSLAGALGPVTQNY